MARGGKGRSRRRLAHPLFRRVCGDRLFASARAGRLMLVYGDGTRLEAVWEKLPEIARGIEAAWRGPAGLARHAELVAVFIAAGELAQGLSDAAFAVRKADARAPAGGAAVGLLLAPAPPPGGGWAGGLSRAGGQPAPAAGGRAAPP